MKKIIYDKYHDFLKTRSFTGKLYRKYWLYPTLCKHLIGKTLDIGPGIGDFIKFRPNTIGLDINPNNVEWCQSQGLDVSLMEINIIPFDNCQIDSIIMDNVLEHIEDPEPLLIEIDRVLKRNGILLVGVPGKLGFSKAPDHEIYYSRKDLINKFVSRGYHLLNIFGLPIDYDLLETKLEQYCFYGVFKKVI